MKKEEEIRNFKDTLIKEVERRLKPNTSLEIRLDNDEYLIIKLKNTLIDDEPRLIFEFYNIPKIDFSIKQEPSKTVKDELKKRKIENSKIEEFINCDF